MTIKKPIERKIYFFQLQRRARKTMTYIPEQESFNWREILEAFDRLDWDKHWFDDQNYFMSVLKDKQYPILAIGEKLKTQFMQQIDNKRKQMTDLADENIKTGNINLAQMSAVVFFPRYNTVGYITGSGKPRVTILEKFLNEVLRDPHQLFEWQVVPVYTKDGLKEFNEKMKSVSVVHLQFSTQRSYLDGGDDGGELLGMGREVTEKLRCDVDVDAKISIRKKTGRLSAGKLLKDMVSKAVPIVSEQQKTIRVKGTTLDDTIMDYEILSHPLMLKADVPQSDETRQFTQLVETLVDVCCRQENSLYELLER